MDNSSVSYLESRKLVKRWNGPIPALVNTIIIFAFFYLTWWIFQDPRGIMRMYTPYVGYMVCRWLLILFIWLAYIFDFWPFKRSWLQKTHPLVKGSVLTLVSVAAMILLIKGFFIESSVTSGLRISTLPALRQWALPTSTQSNMRQKQS